MSERCASTRWPGHHGRQLAALVLASTVAEIGAAVCVRLARPIPGAAGVDVTFPTPHPARLIVASRRRSQVTFGDAFSALYTESRAHEVRRPTTIGANKASVSASDPLGACRSSVLSLALVVSVVLTACATDGHPVIMIDNELAVPLTIVFVSEAGDESSVLETLPADSEYPVTIFPTDRCTPGVLVARDKSSGAEVGRSVGPVCRPSRWVIGPPASDPD
jgi:hypothetical protein